MGLAFVLSILAAFMMPFIFMNAMRNIKKDKPTQKHEVALGVCLVVIVVTILGAFQAVFRLFW